MVYSNRTILVNPFALASQSAGTLNSDGSAVPDNFDEVIIFVNTTVLTGTLDVRYQISPDDGVTWFTRDSATQVTATGQTVLTVSNCIGRFFRVQSVVATGPITRSIACEFKRSGSA